MKNIFITVLLSIFGLGALAQTLSPKATVTAGGVATGGGVTLSFTMGETYNSQLSADGKLLTEGQQQPEINLVTGSVNTSFCAGSSLTVPYTASGYSDPTNTFTAQISDASGSFANPVSIGSVTSNQSGNISANIPNSASGSGYRIRVVSSKPSNIGSDNATIISISTLGVTLTNTVVHPTCSVATGTITVSASMSSLSYSIDGINYTNTTGIFSDVASGTYSVTAKNLEGCTSVGSSVIVDAQPITPAIPTVNVVHPSCTVSTGSITITNTTVGNTYSIDGVNYLNTTGIFTDLQQGSYQVTAKSNVGCISAIYTVTINVQPTTPEAPTVGISQTNCSSAIGIVTVSSPLTGLTFSSDGSDYSNTNGIFNLPAGTYNVTAKNSSGCISSATVIDVNAQPEIPSAPVTTVIHPTCTSASGTITISNISLGNTYSINGSDYSNTTGVLENVPSGTYSVYIKSGISGCISPATSVVVNVQPLTPTTPVVSVTQPAFCVFTATVTVTNVVAGNTYSIDDLDYTNTSGIFNSVTTGNYNVTAKNTVGCISAASNITVATYAPSATITQPTCTSTTVGITVNNPVVGFTYSIDGINYSTGGIFTFFQGVIMGGTYNLTAKNSAGCISGATVLVVNTQPITPARPTSTQTQPSCTVPSGTVSVTSTMTGLSFSVDGINYTTTGIISGLAPANYTLTAKGLVGGCVSPGITAVINALPAIPVAPSITITQPTCSVNTGSIKVSSSTAGLNFSINGTTYNNAFGNFTLLSSGTYNVTARHDVSGCISTATIGIINAQPTIPTAPTASVTQPTCSVSTGTISVNSPVSGYLYSNNGTTYTNTTGLFSGLAAGTYSLTAKSASGCISSASSVVVSAQPATPAAPTLTTTQPTCTISTGSINVTSSKTGLSFSIDGITFTNTTGVFAGLSSGTYSISAKNASGCISTVTSATINAQPATPSAPTASLVQPTCTVATGTITVNSPVSGFTYSINGSTYTNTTGIFTGVASGTYNLTAKNASGCISSASSVVISGSLTTPAAPTVSLTQPTCTLSTGTIKVTSTLTGLTFSIDGSSYTNTTGIFSGVAIGSYSVTAKNALGCTSVSSAAVISSANATPNAPTISIIQPTCNVSTGTITVTSTTTGLTFSKDGVNYSSGGVFGWYQGITAGNTYNITAKSSGGCKSLATVAVLIAQPFTPTAPTVTVTQPTVGVPSGTISVTSSITGLTFSINGTTYTNTTGIFTGVASGSYNVKAKNACGTVSSATVAVVDAIPTSRLAFPTTDTTTIVKVENVNANNLFDVSAYPNPTYTDFKLVLNSTSQESIKVTIFNMLGRMISTLTFNARQTLSIGNDLKEGTYMVEVRQGAHVKTLKLIKYK